MRASSNANEFPKTFKVSASYALLLQMLQLCLLLLLLLAAALAPAAGLCLPEATLHQPALPVTSRFPAGVMTP